MGSGEGIAIGVDDGGATIIVTSRVIAYAVYSYDIALIFDSSCSQ